MITIFIKATIKFLLFMYFEAKIQFRHARLRSCAASSIDIPEGINFVIYTCSSAIRGVLQACKSITLECVQYDDVLCIQSMSRLLAHKCHYTHTTFGLRELFNAWSTRNSRIEYCKTHAYMNSQQLHLVNLFMIAVIVTPSYTLCFWKDCVCLFIPPPPPPPPPSLFHKK